MSNRWRRIHPAAGRWLVAALATTLFLSAACRPSAPRPSSRFVVVGVDGAEWTVLERLWQEGRLPHLARLRDAGVAGRLGTAYVKSPVIWTTIATGVAPWSHGIRDFVVATERGDIPVSSTVRETPALWNMLSSAGRSVAVVGLVGELAGRTDPRHRRQRSRSAGESKSG